MKKKICRAERVAVGRQPVCLDRVRTGSVSRWKAAVGVVGKTVIGGVRGELEG